jgi:hypothetical protein
MFDINKPYTTRDGREVRDLVKLSRQTSNQTLYVGVAPDHFGASFVHCWMADGRFHGSSNSDLINVPEKRTVKVWIVIDGNGDVSAYSVRQRFATYSRPVAQIEREITYTVGEGL